MHPGELPELNDDVVENILRNLVTWKDVVGMSGALGTSRTFRARASHLISELAWADVDAPKSLASFPKLAVVRKLRMSGMDVPVVAAILETLDAVKSPLLAHVTDFKLSLERYHGALTGSIPRAVAALCPRLKSFVAHSMERPRSDFFEALSETLARVDTLALTLHRAPLPSAWPHLVGLTALCINDVIGQRFVHAMANDMPCLTDLEVTGFSLDSKVVCARPCPWRQVRFSKFPQETLRLPLTDGVKIRCTKPRMSWHFGRELEEDFGRQIVALAGCLEPAEETCLTIFMSVKEDRLPRGALSAMAPLFATGFVGSSLQLDAILEEDTAADLADAFPTLCTLNLTSKVVWEAWSHLGRLPSLQYLIVAPFDGNVCASGHAAYTIIRLKDHLQKVLAGRGVSVKIRDDEVFVVA